MYKMTPTYKITVINFQPTLSDCKKHLESMLSLSHSYDDYYASRRDRERLVPASMTSGMYTHGVDSFFVRGPNTSVPVERSFYRDSAKPQLVAPVKRFFCTDSVEYQSACPKHNYVQKGDILWQYGYCLDTCKGCARFNDIQNTFTIFITSDVEYAKYVSGNFDGDVGGMMHSALLSRKSPNVSYLLLVFKDPRKFGQVPGSLPEYFGIDRHFHMPMVDKDDFFATIIARLKLTQKY